jgi:predicted RNA binding protein YcfA (HicA-like mRNA interferase family)
MPKLKVLSGADLISGFEKHGFIVVKQKGSHVKLQRKTPTEIQTLTIPNHKEIDKGTLKAIYRQSLRYFKDVEIEAMFYTP